jgi:integrase
MKKVVLNDKILKALKPADAGKRVVHWDAILPHFGVRVTDRADESGKAAVRSFVVVKRRPGERDPTTAVVGNYNAYAEPGGPGSLAWAREKAREALADIASGHSPDEAEAERRLAERRAKRETFREAAEQFIPELKGLRRGRATEAALRHNFLGQVRDGGGWRDSDDPAWRDLPVAEIKRRDIVQRLDEIKRARGKHAARNALNPIRRFFNWCAEGERFGIEVSPCAGVRDKTIGVTKRDLQRKRVLTDDELVDVWVASGELGYSFGVVVRLLMLTGQRLSDIAGARWREIDVGSAMLTIPPERFKTGVAQEVPLPSMSSAIVADLPRFAAGEYLFTTFGKRPFGGFSRGKAKLDAIIAARREKEGRSPMPGWVIHDIRRSVRTRLVGDCDVDAFIAERVIGHSMVGLHATYDVGTHRPQKRDALQKWEARLLSIVEPPEKPATVVPMRRRAKR